MTPADVVYAARQIQGARNYQEDDFGILDGRELAASSGDLAVLVLADGMGGHVGGATASKLVVQSVLDAYQEHDGLVTDRLRESLAVANEAIAAEIDSRPELDGMGCTLIAAVISTEGLEWISVGDSPMWLYRDGTMRRLNADHSMAPVFAQLVKSGRMTAEDAAADRGRNALRSALVGEEISLIDVSSQPVRLYSSDIIVLASDGIDTLGIDEVSEELSKAKEYGLDAVAEKILRRVDSAEKVNQDNTTVLLFSTTSGGAISGEANMREEPTLTCSSTRTIRRRFDRISWRLTLVVITLALAATLAVTLLYRGGAYFSTSEVPVTGTDDFPSVDK